MPLRDKLKTAPELAVILADHRAQGKKIVLGHGVFDIWHMGHLHQFKQAKKLGDILVISLTTDRFALKGPSRPAFRQNIRAEVIEAVELVDYVILWDAQDCSELIKLLKPDIYVKGASSRELAKDQTSRLSSEIEAVTSVGGQIHFTHEIPIHATPLLSHYIDPYPEHVLAFLTDFKKGYPFTNVADFPDRLKSLKVIVIGETVIDQYDFVQPMGLSPKGGVVAMKYLNTEMFGGGSLACANHIANFCSDVTLVSAIGSRNSHRQFINDSLPANVRWLTLIRDGFSTIIKRREIDPTYFKKYSETYTFDEVPLTNKEEEGFIELLIEGGIKNADLVFVLDYAHGLMTKRVIDFVSKEAPFLSVNTQTNSGNKGMNDVTKYPKVDFVCLDHFEASLVFRDQWGLISNENKIEKLISLLHSSFAAITLGHRGSLVSNGKENFEIPTFSKRVIDTVGAGDAYYSLMAPCVCAGLPLELCGFIGNAAGALATTYLGNKTSINSHMLLGFIETLLS